MNQKNTIKSYELHRNDDGTYCVEVWTDAFTITYDKVEVEYLYGDTMVFPVRMVVRDDSGEIILGWDLLQHQSQQQPENTTEENQEPLAGEVE